ncbi:hypothetical protein EYF80_006984 [Liparis tanakae]|uniref:Uncharacterized protein n=1 Tax=Liparis tanakae TaxID=230148 RepID=A0A4Z2IZX2_9TELE|nr:hypothetical protein EYF80_006984 [Liparis tanakae]
MSSNQLLFQSQKNRRPSTRPLESGIPRSNSKRSLDTSTDWQTSGARTSKCCSQPLTSSSLSSGQAENSLGY